MQLLFAPLLLLGAATPVTVDAHFPGGNVIVEGIEGDDVRIHQDLRDTQGDWFYWCFRVRGAAGRMLTFHFTRSNVIGVRGPAASTDGGKSWRWLGKESVAGSSFRYAFPPDAGDVRFCFGMPYLQANLEEFLRRHQGSPFLKAETLCRSERGRPVELLRAGRLDGKAEHRVLLTSRHHCCEMMATYSLEGLLETVLAGDEGEWLRRHVEFAAVPFVDKDGAEEGDQGKNRRPHDHNRDYGPEPRYAAVRAVKELGARFHPEIALDLHCPHIRGDYNEHIYFVGGPDQENWARVGELAKILEETQTGPLPYRAAGNLPYGKAWNTNSNENGGISFGRWAAGLPGMRVAGSIEIPYANVRGQEVTADSARAFGKDLARAIGEYLKREG